jgi:hypothetical protein
MIEVKLLSPVTLQEYAWVQQYLLAGWLGNNFRHLPYFLGCFAG